MTEHVIQVATRANYDTVSHGDTALGGTPYQLCWRDIKDSTLGPRFKWAMIKLEELLYAVCGARPQYDQADASRRYWYKRENPRCMWGPEQWESPEGTYVGTRPAGFGVTRWAHYHEMSALGERGLGGVPTIPVRSRSGDPAFQVRLTEHASVVFPAGSVWRSPGAEVHDPRSTRFQTPFKQFPDVAEIPSQTVTIYYRPPAGVTFDASSL